jgi:hypothetical protein
MNNITLEFAIYFYAWAGLTSVIFLSSLLIYIIGQSILEWTLDKLAHHHYVRYSVGLLIGMATSKIPYIRGDKYFVLTQLEHRFWLMATENPDLARDFIRIVHKPKTKEHRELFSYMFGIKLLETMDELRISLIEDNKELSNDSEED